MRCARIVTLLGLGLIAGTVAARADDPPPRNVYSYPRGGADRTGAFTDLHLPERPRTGWIAELGVRHIGSPVIAGDRVILGNGQDEVIAISLTTGEEIWTRYQPGLRVYRAPLVVGKVVFCSSDIGISALNLEDGLETWHTPIEEGALGSPLVVAGLVVVGGGDGFVHGLDASTGEERWKADIVTDKPPDPGEFVSEKARTGKSAARPGTAASDGTRVFVPIFDQSRVVALDLKTGEPRWSYQTKGWIGGGPTVAEGKVFVGSQDFKIYALDAATGNVAWTFETKWRADGDLAYADGSIYACASDGRCYRIDAKTGRKVWEYETELGPDKKHFFLSGAPLVDATAVYFGSWDGHLYALNRKEGTLRWKHRPYTNGEHVGAAITDGKRLFVPLSALFDYDKQKDKEGVHGIVEIVEDRP